MPLEVDYVTGGYIVRVAPPTVGRAWSNSTPLSADEVTAHLSQMGVHPRDIDDAIEAADKHHQAGTTERVRFFRRIRHRIETGAVDSDDLDTVRQELIDEHSRIDKVWLIGMLLLAGHGAPSEATILNRLRLSRNDDEIQVALRALAAWSSSSYEHVAVDLIDGRRPGVSERVRRWAIIYAGHLLRVGTATRLLEEIVRVATDPAESPNVRRDARFALADAAQIEHPDAIVFSGSDAEQRDLIDRARRKVHRQ